MASGYACQRCSQLPPPPPMFTISPPPNILSIEVRCPSRSLSSLIENKKSTSSSSISIALGIIIAFLITFSTIVLIKKRLIKRQQKHKIKFDKTMKIIASSSSSSSVKFNRHHQNNNNNTNHNHHRHRHHQNRSKFIPLLSDSCSSDQTSSTPPNEYRCTNGVIEPLLTCDLPHEYEQIKCDDSLSESLHYYCLIYCRQCSNYHPTSSSSSSSSSLCPRSNLLRPYYLPLSTNSTCQHQCSCYHRTYYQQRNDNRFFELQPMLTTKIDNNSEESSNHMAFIEETPPI